VFIFAIIFYLEWGKKKTFTAFGRKVFFWFFFVLFCFTICKVFVGEFGRGWLGDLELFGF
jgi:hypothetical protein